jgi:hypothetical protein
MSISSSNGPIRLAKLATIFAATFVIAFGLCTGTALTGGLGSEQAMPFLIGTSVVIEGVCLVGLLVVGIWAIVRASNRKSPH